MHHNLSAATKRRIGLTLTTRPQHLNHRRRRTRERAGAIALVLWLACWLAAIALHIATW